ncbi:hypothetical protein D3C72_1842670 [compost metagenome]
MRPVGETLGEGIDRHEDQREYAGRDCETVELQKHDEPGKRLQDDEDLGLHPAHAAGRQRPRTGARHGHVDLVVGQIIIGAARTTHRHRPDEEQRQMPDQCRPGKAAACHRHIGRKGCGPETRPHQQLPADGAIPSCKLRIGPEGPRQNPIDPVVGWRVGNAV